MHWLLLQFLLGLIFLLSSTHSVPSNHKINKNMMLLDLTDNPLHSIFNKKHSNILPLTTIQASNLHNDASTFTEAIRNTIVTFSSAALFGLATFLWKGKKASLEFFTAFLVEKSLSVDNLFVFLMLFEYFKIPSMYQNRVLTWGLLGAVVMRGIMIFVGVAAIQKFQWITLLFSGILIVSSYKLFFESEDHSPDLSNNFILKLSKRFINSTDILDGENFFTKESGKKLATPLFMCLIAIEISDFIFAVDSIPAVLGISKDPFIIYTSNIFAILGMRSLYVLISKAVATLKYLRPSVAGVLGFVGCKMIAEYFHFEISPLFSLFIIGSILSVGFIASILNNNKKIE